MSAPPDWVTIKIVLTAIETGSVTRAADRCGIATSAAAKRIQMLELDLGSALLKRGARGVRPSCPGAGRPGRPPEERPGGPGQRRPRQRAPACHADQAESTSRANRLGSSALSHCCRATLSDRTDSVRSDVALVALISMGGWFELYDLFFTGYIAPGLAKSGILASTTESLLLWRFIAGIGVGVEIITIDAYITEMVPRPMRGRAFAFNQAVMFSSVPVVALLAKL